MIYREMPPSPRLAPWVRCLWIFASAEAPRPQRIVPDGRPELVVHFGAPYEEQDPAGNWRAQPAALFAGQLTRPLVLRPTGPAGVLGVRFHPDGAHRFAPCPLHTLTDCRIAIDDWWPDAGRRLVDAMGTQASDEERVAIAEAFVHDRIARDGTQDALVRSWVAALEAQDASMESAMPAGVGRRQVERRFAAAVGIGPARLAGIFRFRRAFDLLERDGTRPWTEAAVAAGYYDQSHFIRDFRRYVGCTPSEFLGEAGELAEALAAPR